MSNRHRRTASRPAVFTLSYAHVELNAHGTLNLETAMASEAIDAAKILTTAPEHKRAGAADVNVEFAG